MRYAEQGVQSTRVLELKWPFTKLLKHSLTMLLLIKVSTSMEVSGLMTLRIGVANLNSPLLSAGRKNARWLKEVVLLVQLPTEPQELYLLSFASVLRAFGGTAHLLSWNHSVYHDKEMMTAPSIQCYK